MWLVLCGIALALWVLTAASPWQAHRTRERLSAAGGPVSLSDVTVLIPARNEAASIQAVIKALAKQGPDLHVCVVDDQSNDATAALAKSAGKSLQQPTSDDLYSVRLDVIDGQSLPAGWSGKLWALQQGLDKVRRRYCLLLDAEIVLAPFVIPQLLQTAKAEKAALVSIMASLQCKAFWEKLLVPPFIFFFKLLFPFALVNSSNSRLAAAAGGCILIETEALQRVGGFASWSSALIDDCTLATHIKRAGLQTRLYLSRDVVSLRRYDRISVFWGMVTRTAFTQLRYSVLLLVATTLMMLIVFVVPVVAMLGYAVQFLIGPWSLVAAASQPLAAVAAGLALAVMTGVFAPVVRYYELTWAWAWTLPIAAVLFLAMTWHSAINYWSGTRAVWKARQYENSPK